MYDAAMKVLGYRNSLNRQTLTLGFGLLTIFFVCFRWAPHLHLLDSIFDTRTFDWWNSFQKDSDSLLVERLISNSHQGLTSHLSALGPNGSYNSQFGLNGWLISILPSALCFNLEQATN
jgi:hypothetical protein